MEKYSLRVHNAKPTDDWGEIKSPFDGKSIAQIERGNNHTIEQALQNAQFYFEHTMKKMPAWKRAEIIRAVATEMEHNVEDLAQTIALEGGKPKKDARVEVIRAINTMRMSAEEAVRLNGEQITMDRAKGSENHTAYTVKQGVGPVLAISAFNHPVNLICHQVATAFAAGNTVIVKPASQTPISAIKIVNFFKKAGLPDGVISLLMIPGKETEKVVTDKRIKFITFIGSAEVGWNLQKIIQPGVRMELEHGGTAVCVLDKMARLDRAVPAIVKGGFYHAGQVCVSTQIVYVHDSIYKEFMDDFTEQVGQLKTGDATDESTDVGPIISKYELDRVDEWVMESISQGAKLRKGGHRINSSCYAPTILENVTTDMKVYKQEVFGPVVSVIRYTDLEDIIRTVNRTNYSFQTSIFTQDIDTAMFYAKNIETKACIINDHTAFRVDWMPFGGAKESGLHVGGVKYSIEDMTEEKLIVMKNYNL